MKMRCYLSNSLNNEWWLLQIIVFATAAESHTHVNVWVWVCVCDQLISFPFSFVRNSIYIVLKQKPLDDTYKVFVRATSQRAISVDFLFGHFVLIPLKIRIYLFIDWFRWKNCLARMQTKHRKRKERKEKRIKTNRTKTYAHPHSCIPTNIRVCARANKHHKDQITFISMSWIWFQISLFFFSRRRLLLLCTVRLSIWLDSFFCLSLLVVCPVSWHILYCSSDCVSLIESFLFLEIHIPDAMQPNTIHI